jgi:hypothetical protein
MMMQVKMIRDCGAFKKGETYEVEPKKSVALLTGGFCVRICEEEKDFKKELTFQGKHKKQKSELTEKSDVL